ncbi:type B 50S ribosomal protein L31 [Pimelobacter simplex]|uniref:50S ribosomal protein L31 n=1 Tax=Nocardioides simplex TaxID=2045 RepID=A0A0A1DH69_NOCSI|nr:type B 50S ribosomal protein L31 [Pimelobacter simplex]AIY15937.1 LSU ribosomal protein L31p [Pimelobacter simplex]MCG8150899.1 type B 50S ribosomal protein L31 [Pimelobacter simplex]GEB12465.1 50S ribosomal protein L31 type B [Pimelobacter simplex]SFM94669.1 large subunit ribosomal protein L31 [Pimelobacter simplex]
MKQGIHPAYGPVVFRDRATGDLVLTRSTLVAAAPAATVELDGATYPVVDVDVSVHSHPFWTGRGRVLDSEGRVEAFERRYGRAADR